MNVGKLAAPLALLNKARATEKSGIHAGKLSVENLSGTLILSVTTSAFHLRYAVETDNAEDFEETLFDIQSLRAAAGKGECDLTLLQGEKISSENDEESYEPRSIRIIEDEIEAEVLAADVDPPEPLQLADSEKSGSVQRSDLLAYLDWVSLAMCADEGRPHLAAIALHPVYGMVATDGHRLHASPAFDGMKPPGDKPFLLPAVNIPLLLGMLKQEKKTEAARFSYNGDSIVISCGQWALVAKREEASFPPVDKVIPDWESWPRASYDWKRMKKACEKSGKIHWFSTVQWSPNGLVMFTEEDNRKISVRLDTTATGECAKFGVNNKYLREACCDSGSIFADESATGPKIVSHSMGFAVVMPSRLS